MKPENNRERRRRERPSWSWPLRQRPSRTALRANRRRPNLEWLEHRVLLSVVDLTTVGSSGTINGAVYRQGTVTPAGSGNLSSFVRIQQTGTEYGYNTGARPYTDPVLLNGGTDTTATFNRSVALSTVPIIAIGGQAYLDFALDINQIGSAPLLSLDEVQISLASSGTLQGYTSNGTYGGQATLVYDMGGNSSTWVKLNRNLSSGSGGSDMYMDIPLSDLPDTASAGPTAPSRSRAEPTSISIPTSVHRTSIRETHSGIRPTTVSSNGRPPPWARSRPPSALRSMMRPRTHRS